VPTSATTTSPAPAPAPAAKPNHTGAIVGGAVGGVLGLALIALAGIFLCYRRRGNTADSPNTAQPMPNLDFIAPVAGAGAYGPDDKAQMPASPIVSERPESTVYPAGSVPGSPPQGQHYYPGWSPPPGALGGAPMYYPGGTHSELDGATPSPQPYYPGAQELAGEQVPLQPQYAGYPGGQVQAQYPDAQELAGGQVPLQPQHAGYPGGQVQAQYPGEPRYQPGGEIQRY
jgi:hypothetical protein